MTSDRRSLLPLALGVAFLLGLGGLSSAVSAAASDPSASPSASASVAPSASASPTPSASGSPAPSASSSAAALPSRPPTVDRPLPANLTPTLAKAATDYPISYLDGCHVEENGKSSHPSTCLYGNLKSTTTIALFGDSHALGWFTAMQGVAAKHGWRLLDLTMSTCSPAIINEWIPAWNRISIECTAWRKAALARLASVKPALIVVTGTRGFAAADGAGHVLSGTARTQAWQTGMLATLARLKADARRVLMIADTPLTVADPIACPALHPQSLLICTTPVTTAINADWLSLERATAATAKVGFLDAELWVCPTSPCPVVIGNVLVFRNGGHLTATFGKTLAARLDAAIAALH
jgi:hypothetical protein